MELICGYMDDAAQRHRLNALTRETFGFDFEDWVTGGCHTGDYIPYSLLQDGRIVSNVSANRMTFLQNGQERHYIQIGTVMTDARCRRRGLARKLMEHVIAEYAGRCDGIYLFGDLSALDFYRKLGFREILQTRYTLRGGISKQAGPFLPVDGQDGETRRKYRAAVRKAAVFSSMEQMNRFGLQMFYTASMDNVYYAEDLDCYAAWRRDGGVLTLQSVICETPLPLAQVLSRIGEAYETLRLGFSPLPRDAGLFSAEPYDGGEDYRLFILGDALKDVEREGLCFPAFSHA